MTPEEQTRQAEKLIAALEGIPISELVACARDNLTATRRIRTSKDKPEGELEPDYATRQKALEWIGAMIGAAPTAARKPVEPVKSDKAGSPEPGSLIGKAGKPKTPAHP